MEPYGVFWAVLILAASLFGSAGSLVATKLCFAHNKPETGIGFAVAGIVLFSIFAAQWFYLAAVFAP